MIRSKLGSASREKINNLGMRNNSLCLPPPIILTLKGQINNGQIKLNSKEYYVGRPFKYYKFYCLKEIISLEFRFIVIKLT